jgi:RND family efflux transporter MFP subunit
VDGSAGDPVLRVIDPSRLQVSVQVPVGDLARIRVGRPSRVKVPGAETEEWDGTVLSLPAAVDAATGTATVRVSSPAGLVVGTPVQVEIQAEEHAGVVVVPAAAILKEEGKAAVFVVGPDAKAHRRDVTGGLETTADAEVTKGVTAGEKVIVKGQEELPDGAAVSVDAALP